jgi:hypothetical protein
MGTEPLTIRVSGGWALGPEQLGQYRLLTCPSVPRVCGHDDRRVLQVGAIGQLLQLWETCPGRPLPTTACPAPSSASNKCSCLTLGCDSLSPARGEGC